MSDQDKAIQVIRALPATASMDDIIEELCDYVKIEEGLRDEAAGRVISVEELERRSQTWISK